ncbi:fimbrial protein [Trinickia mobilis]|uniref:fimbrial protein n=1 Tax=Trinickia mobilis TaxID=2816356 RepID=UPI001A8CF26A|nr:fimbrial protein [Trinickia mobilis]
MNKQSVLLPIALLTGTLSASAFAANGTVNFNGEVTNATCSIAPQSQNQQVSMGSVNARSFKNKGDISAPVPFEINLADCILSGKDASGKDFSFSTATVTFNGAADTTDNTALGLTNASSNTSAKGVAIQLRDQQGKVVAINGNSDFELVPGSNSIKLQAAYVATGDQSGATAVQAGQANGTAEFNLQYK